MRFRRESLTFKVAQNVQDQVDTSRESQHEHTYPSMSKTMGTFKLAVEAGSFGNSQIVVMLGQNGTGKTTFIRMLAGLLPPDDDKTQLPRLGVSYKPQKIAPKFEVCIVFFQINYVRPLMEVKYLLLSSASHSDDTNHQDL